MGENIIATVVFSMVSLILIAIGLSQFKSKEPVGFYTGGKPPKVEELVDVIGWNRKHGLMWMFYGIAMILAFIGAGLVNNEMAASIIICAIIFGSMPIMMAYHHYLKKKYYKQ